MGRRFRFWQVPVVSAVALASCGPPATPECVRRGVEVCNGLDDDCNGLTDDNVSTRGEVCNGIDDDCDGATDEGVSPQPEVCNGVDDDCDGVVDNGVFGVISGPWLLAELDGPFGGCTGARSPGADQALVTWWSRLGVALFGSGFEIGHVGVSGVSGPVHATAIDRLLAVSPFFTAGGPGVATASADEGLRRVDVKLMRLLPDGAVDSAVQTWSSPPVGVVWANVTSALGIDAPTMAVSITLNDGTNALWFLHPNREWLVRGTVPMYAGLGDLTGLVAAVDGSWASVFAQEPPGSVWIARVMGPVPGGVETIVPVDLAGIVTEAAEFPLVMSLVMFGGMVGWDGQRMIVNAGVPGGSRETLIEMGDGSRSVLVVAVVSREIEPGMAATRIVGLRPGRWVLARWVSAGPDVPDALGLWSLADLHGYEYAESASALVSVSGLASGGQVVFDYWPVATVDDAGDLLIVIEVGDPFREREALWGYVVGCQG